jgi:DNA-binding transcriptional LysR family regulator
LAEFLFQHRVNVVLKFNSFDPLAQDLMTGRIAAIETGRGIALAIPAFKHVSGKRLLYRPLAGTTEMFSVGIARAKNGDVTPAGEKFCEMLRKVAKETSSGKSLKLRA